MTEQVNHPSHYNQESIKIETIELIDLLTDRAAFDLGNAIKYICRAPYKGSTYVDLEKALWYINDYILNSNSRGVIELSKFEKDQLRKVYNNMKSGSRLEEYSGTILESLVGVLTFGFPIKRTRDLIVGTLALVKGPAEK